MDHNKDSVSGLHAEQEALTTLGQLLYSELPEGFAAVELLIPAALAATSQEQFCLIRADGAKEAVRRREAMRVSDAAAHLRRVMYRPGAGTWFSARFVVTAQGSMDAEYNYDDEPQWDFEVVPWTYANDLEHFPRDPEHIPAWLQQKLDEAAAES